MIFKEIATGTIAGLVIGMPQGMHDIPVVMSHAIPIKTIVIVTLFGAFGGLMFSYQMLNRTNKRKYSLGVYFLFMVAALSIGIPTIFRNFNGSLIESITIQGLFFTSIGIAMSLGGIFAYVFQKQYLGSD